MSTEEKQMAVVLREKGVIAFEPRPIPTIEDPYYVKLKIEKTGICGSDIHYFLHGSIGQFVLKDPMVLGHESSGTVVEIGNKVTKVAVGDRVAIEPGVPSRYSEETKSGRYNLCREMQFAATPPYDGTLVKYYLSPEDFLTKLPNGVTLEEGALAEPLAVAVHANKIGGTRFGDTVVIFGAGPVGLLTGAVAKAFGAMTIVYVDVLEPKLELAKSFGAKHVINSAGINDPDELANMIQGTLHGIEPNVTFDCCGVQLCIAAAIKVCTPGGTHVQVGNGKGSVSVPVVDITTKELRFLGSFRYAVNDYKTAVSLIAGKQVDVSKLITHRFTFKQAIDAYKFNATTNENVVKTMISGPE